MIKILTANLCVESPRRDAEVWASVILRESADVVMLQEVFDGYRPTPEDNMAARIADVLGWSVSDLDLEGHTCVISPFEQERKEMEGPTALHVPEFGERLYVRSVHLTDEPYGPAQAARSYFYPGSPHLDSAEELVAAADAARGPVLRSIIRSFDDHAPSGSPCAIAGDMNEPSHLDWTEEERARGFCDLAVPWPASRSLEDAGFVDSALASGSSDRKAVDRVSWPAPGWSSSPGERSDRIDFIHVKNLHAADQGRLFIPELSDHAILWTEVMLTTGFR